MFSKIILSQTRLQGLRCVRRYHGDSLGHGVPEKYMKFRTGHMDEALKPEGQWKEAFNKQQSKYNKQLFFSIVYFVATVAYVVNTVDFVLPPPMKNE